MKVSEKICELAQGGSRKALKLLNKVIYLEDEEEMLEVLKNENTTDTSESIELCDFVNTTVLILQAAGLPNITGCIYNPAKYDNNGGSYSGGAFYDQNGYSQKSNYAGQQGGACAIMFDASHSSAIYGKSDTVQPANATVRLWKRIS